jgi:hypothetical protein
VSSARLRIPQQTKSRGGRLKWTALIPTPHGSGDGKLSEIPFGVKDIIETRGLSTEYGSPVYKGQIGTADAAIVRKLRQRTITTHPVLSESRPSNRTVGARVYTQEV